MAYKYGHIHRYFIDSAGNRFLALPTSWRDERRAAARHPDWRGASRRRVDAAFGRRAVEDRLKRVNSIGKSAIELLIAHEWTRKD